MKMRAHSPMRWIVQQIPAVKPTPATFNPRPAAQIVAGSTTHRVFLFLQKHAGVSFRYSELLKHADPCTPSALVWACAFLREHGYINAYPDAFSGRTKFRYVYTGKQ